MVEFKETFTKTVNCPGCGHDRVVKIGFQRGQQRYRCKACKKDFRANGKAPGRQMDAEMMGSAIRDFYSGKCYKQIAEGLKDEYDIPEPSKATVYEWVRDYTDDGNCSDFVGSGRPPASLIGQFSIEQGCISALCEHSSPQL